MKRSIVCRVALTLTLAVAASVVVCAFVVAPSTSGATLGVSSSVALSHGGAAAGFGDGISMDSHGVIHSLGKPTLPSHPFAAYDHHSLIGTESTSSFPMVQSSPDTDVLAIIRDDNADVHLPSPSIIDLLHELSFVVHPLMDAIGGWRGVESIFECHFSPENVLTVTETIGIFRYQQRISIPPATVIDQKRMTAHVADGKLVVNLPKMIAAPSQPALMPASNDNNGTESAVEKVAITSALSSVNQTHSAEQLLSALRELAKAQKRQVEAQRASIKAIAGPEMSNALGLNDGEFVPYNDKGQLPSSVVHVTKPQVIDASSDFARAIEAALAQALKASPNAQASSPAKPATSATKAKKPQQSKVKESAVKQQPKAKPDVKASLASKLRPGNKKPEASSSAQQPQSSATAASSSKASSKPSISDKLKEKMRKPSTPATSPLPPFELTARSPTRELRAYLTKAGIAHDNVMDKAELARMARSHYDDTVAARKRRN